MKTTLYILLTLSTLLTSRATAQDVGKGVLLITSSYAEDSLKVSDLYMQAIHSLITQEDKSNSYSIFNKILEINPDHAPTLFHIASLTSNLTDALTMSKRSVELDPTNIEYNTLYSEILLKNKEIAKGIKVWQDVVKLDNNNVKRHLHMASIYMSASMPYAAISTLDSAATLFGKRPDILSYQQNIYQRLRMADKELEASQALISLIPDDASLHTQLARSYMSQSKDSLAWQHLNLASQLDSINVDMLAAKSDMYLTSGNTTKYLSIIGTIFALKSLDLDTKIAFFKNSIEKPEYYRDHKVMVDNLINTLRITYPDSYKATKLHTRHLLNTGETTKALDVYKKHLNDSTNLEDVYTNIIGLESYIKQSRDSIVKYSNQAKQLFPRSLDMQIGVSSAYLQLKEYKEAINVAKAALDIVETDSLRSMLYGYIGDIYHESSKPSTAYKYYNKALKHNSNNIIVLNNYSYYLSEEGEDLEKALTMSSLVLASEPDNSTYIDTYGWILYKLGRYEEAKKHIRRALALSERDNEVLLLHLGDIFLALGDKFTAEIYWDKALKGGANKDEVAERKAKL